MRQDRDQLNRWMAGASSNDRGAFGMLAAAVQDELYRFALAHGLAAPDAAEAVQETLLRAYGKRRKWHKDADALAWLYGIAMNVVRESRRQRRKGLPLLADAEAILAAATDGRDRAAGEEVSLRRLAEALADLPRRQREAVTCRFLRRMSIKDAAAAMGCAEGTVKAAVFSGLVNLRRIMKVGQDR